MNDNEILLVNYESAYVHQDLYGKITFTISVYSDS